MCRSAIDDSFRHDTISCRCGQFLLSNRGKHLHTQPQIPRQTQVVKATPWNISGHSYSYLQHCQSGWEVTQFVLRGSDFEMVLCMKEIQRYDDAITHIVNIYLYTYFQRGCQKSRLSRALANWASTCHGTMDESRRDWDIWGIKKHPVGCFSCLWLVYANII